MKRLLTSASLCLALGLAACGGTTVESDDVTATQAPPTATSSASGTAKATTSEGAKPASKHSGPADQPAREVTSIPEQAPTFSPKEQAFLDQLQQSGVNVKGVEDQLTATGATVCNGDSVTRDAVAGQLVEQRRTDLDANAVAALIGETAQSKLCK